MARDPYNPDDKALPRRSKAYDYSIQGQAARQAERYFGAAAGQAVSESPGDLVRRLRDARPAAVANPGVDPISRREQQAAEALAATQSVERGGGRARKFGATPPTAPAVPTTPSGDVGPARVAAPKTDTLKFGSDPNVYRSRQVINGVEQNVYSDSAYDPLHRGVTSLRQSDALAAVDPEFAAQRELYNADRAASGRAIEAERKKREAEAREILSEKLTKSRAPSEADVAKTTAEAALKAAQADKTTVETARADADATEEARKRVAKPFDDIFKERLDVYSGDRGKIIAQRRYGRGVTPRAAAALDAIRAIGTSNIGAITASDNTTYGENAISAILESAIGDSNLIRKFVAGDSIGRPGVTAGVDPRKLRFGGTSRLLRFADYVGRQPQQFTVGTDDPARGSFTVKPQGSELDRESLESIVSILKQIDRK